MITLAGQVVTLDAVLTDGIVRIDGGWIVAVETGPAPADAIQADFVLPGLVDLHCHGGGGASVDQPDAAAVAEFHRRHGTTSLLASLVSASPAVLRNQLRALASHVADGTFLGVHLEGPFLAPARRGAHLVDALRDPDLGELADWQSTGLVRMITLAPELPYATKLIEQAATDGVIVAIGHTDASAAECRAGIEAGARVATHLWNGMPPLHHRDGGAVANLLADGRVRCELIADGHHLSDDVLLLSLAALGPERALLVTDAAAPAGCPDGEYLLGLEQVRLSGGRIGTVDGRSLAGSALTLIDAVRHVLGLGYPLVDAVRAASANPAAVLSAADIGQIAIGHRADLVLTDDALQVQAVLRRGEWQ